MYKKILISSILTIIHAITGYAQSELLKPGESSYGIACDVTWMKAYTTPTISLIYSRKGNLDFGLSYSSIPKTKFYVYEEEIAASAKAISASVMYHYRKHDSSPFATAIGMGFGIPDFTGKLKGQTGSVMILPYFRYFDRKDISCTVLGFTLSAGMSHLSYKDSDGDTSIGDFKISNSIGSIFEYRIGIRPVMLALSAAVYVPVRSDKIYYKQFYGGVAVQLMYAF